MHLLHDEAFIQLVGENSPRRTGRTTAMALAILSQAIVRPGQKIYVNDHHGTHRAALHLMNMTKDFAEKLGLQFMNFRPHGHPYPYVVFGKDPE